MPSFLLIVTVIPLTALLFGWFWSSLPRLYRRWIKPGYEFSPFLILLVVSYVAWHLGPVLERWLFVVTNPATGEQVADFLSGRQAVTTSFEQRNSLVVGFMMGFAVIPIIFTITEDALSSVPPRLTLSHHWPGGEPLANRHTGGAAVAIIGRFSVHDDWPRTGCSARR